MARPSSEELAQEANRHLTAAVSAVGAGDVELGVEEARLGFAAAKSQRSHLLKSRAYVVLIESLASGGDELSREFKDRVEDAFDWAETMPEEIQVWLLAALLPHLAALDEEFAKEGRPRLAQRAEDRAHKAADWLTHSMNVQTRLQAIHLDDVENGRAVDPRALALERTGGYYADQLFDPDARLLADAARAWAKAGRPDRGARIDELVAEIRAARSA